jgi:Zn-dependent protease
MFRLFDFRVEITPSFLLVVGVSALFEISYGGSLLHAIQWGMVLLLSIVVHELGHAFAARAYGLRVGTIQLHFLGGHVTHDRTRPRRQLAISLAGTAAGLALGALTWIASQALPPTILSPWLVRDMLYVNVLWSFVNLLPLYPLDGGMAFQSALSLWRGERRAVRTTSMVGIALGLGLLVVSWSMGAMFFPFIAAMAAYTNWQRLQSV